MLNKYKNIKKKVKNCMNIQFKKTPLFFVKRRYVLNYRIHKTFFKGFSTSNFKRLPLKFLTIFNLLQNNSVENFSQDFSLLLKSLTIIHNSSEKQLNLDRIYYRKSNFYRKLALWNVGNYYFKNKKCNLSFIFSQSSTPNIKIFKDNNFYKTYKKKYIYLNVINIFKLSIFPLFFYKRIGNNNNKFMYIKNYKFKYFYKNNKNLFLFAKIYLNNVLPNKYKDHNVFIFKNKNYLSYVYSILLTSFLFSKFKNNNNKNKLLISNNKGN